VTGDGEVHGILETERLPGEGRDARKGENAGQNPGEVQAHGLQVHDEACREALALMQDLDDHRQVMAAALQVQGGLEVIPDRMQGEHLRGLAGGFHDELALGSLDGQIVLVPILDPKRDGLAVDEQLEVMVTGGPDEATVRGLVVVVRTGMRRIVRVIGVAMPMGVDVRVFVALVGTNGDGGHEAREGEGDGQRQDPDSHEARGSFRSVRR
jgi:hypothetical protein